MAKTIAPQAAAADLALTDEEYAKQLLSGLIESRTTVLATGGGKPLLRLLKDGIWVFGQDDAEVQKGSHWAINVKTLGWGSVCWTNYPDGPEEQAPRPRGRPDDAAEAADARRRSRASR